MLPGSDTQHSLHGETIFELSIRLNRLQPLTYRPVQIVQSLLLMLVGMLSIVDIFTLSIKLNRKVGYRIKIIDILYPNNAV